MVKRRKDGRLQSSISVTNPLTGERERKYFYGYTEAELAVERAKALAAANDISQYTKSRILFADYAKDFINERHVSGKISQNTFESYEFLLGKHILPNLPPGIKLGDIKIFHIKKILENVSPTSFATKGRVYSIINLILKEAVFELLLPENVCEHVRKPTHTPEPAAVISPEDYKRMLAEVVGTVYYYALIVDFGTGCRRGELCYIKWSDFDQAAKTLRITGSQKRGQKTKFFEGPPKSKYSLRVLPLSDSTIETLLEWKKILRLKLMALGLPFEEDGYIFRSESDPTKPLSIIQLSNKVRYLRKKLNLPPRTCLHSLRHTHATTLAEHNVTTTALKARLGHAKASFTYDKYVHPTEHAQDGVDDVIEEIESIYNVN